MNITVLGTGYVGIVSAAVLADFGHNIWGLDIDPKRVENLKKGKSPIYEPGLEELLQKGLENQKLQFTTDYGQALEKTDIIFICVGTPQAESGEVELKYVYSAIEQIAKNLQNPSLIVLKSTVPPGIHLKLKEIMDQNTKVSYEFASTPEFLREGTAVSDTFNPDRIIIGTESEKAQNTLLEIHKGLPGKRLCTDIISAQMIKYASNSFLACKISFANAIARICDLLGANVLDVMQGIGMDNRIGEKFLSPGLGFGGSCFPKDIKGLYFLSKQAGYDFKLLDEVSEINDSQVAYYLTKTEKIIGNFADKNITILGLAFKPDTDDMRESRTIPLVNELLEKGAKITAYDPIATETAKVVFGDKIIYAKDKFEAIRDCDILILATDWNEFKNMDLVKIKQLMKGNIFVDGRNLYNPKDLKQFGFVYVGIGRI
ncbi:UDP-glucose/GDP-mannose dehydrogenase family protein [Candidatus Beckwithbacteria bacterium]|nr:UDP-glucose/GDP-mannose dehydrogenase family protein [Candidatus Beckwithbacteria bacterium]